MIQGYFEITLRHFEIALRHFRHHPALLRDRVRRGMNTKKAQSFAKQRYFRLQIRVESIKKTAPPSELKIKKFETAKLQDVIFLLFLKEKIAKKFASFAENA